MEVMGQTDVTSFMRKQIPLCGKRLLHPAGGTRTPDAWGHPGKGGRVHGNDYRFDSGHPHPQDGEGAPEIRWFPHPCRGDPQHRHPGTGPDAFGLELTAANLCVEFASLKKWGGNCDNWAAWQGLRWDFTNLNWYVNFKAFSNSTKNRYFFVISYNCKKNCHRLY